MSNPTVYPWSIHGFLTATFKDPESSSGYSSVRGTGTLVSENCILTAAHCLYRFNEQTSTFESPVNIRFITGLQNAWLIFGKKMNVEIQALDFFVHPKYLEGDTLDYDFGLVKLDTPIGRTTGWASLKYYEERQLSKLKINVTGYPGIKSPISAVSYGFFRVGSYNMYTMEGPIKTITPHRIFYPIDTSGGQSGSGVWIVNQEGLVECVGVHTTGDKILGNGAVRINEENFNVLLEWFSKFGQI